MTFRRPENEFNKDIPMMTNILRPKQKEQQQHEQNNEIVWRHSYDILENKNRSDGVLEINDVTTKPRFILHIGPHKSATTTLQCILHQEVDSLLTDSIIFMGKADLQFCATKTMYQNKRIKKLDTCMLDDNCWAELNQEWESHYQEKKNVLISKEKLSWMASSQHSKTEERNLFWSRLKLSLQKWDVQIVITYRRYFEWLVSAKYQHDYHMKLQVGGWPVNNTDYNRIVDPIFPFIQQVLKNETVTPYPYVDVMLQEAQRHFPVVMLNIHETNDIVRSFICDYLQATKTCLNLSHQPSKRSSSNELLFDQLNVGAKMKGWITNYKLRRLGLAKKSQAYFYNKMRKNITDMALKCPSRLEAEQLLDRSLAYEKALQPNMVNSEIAHTTSFWEYFNRHKFCSVNVDQELTKNNDWQSFYESLN